VTCETVSAYTHPCFCNRAGIVNGREIEIICFVLLRMEFFEYKAGDKFLHMRWFKELHVNNLQLQMECTNIQIILVTRHFRCLYDVTESSIRRYRRSPTYERVAFQISVRKSFIWYSKPGDTHVRSVNNCSQVRVECMSAACS
jgi:hypothetical protein